MSVYLSPGTVLDNRYKIKRVIKASGVSALYEAIDQKCNHMKCSIEEMSGLSMENREHQHFIDRFMKEANILRRLRHPHLPVVMEYFVSSKRFYLVMNYIEGEDLLSIMLNCKDKRIPEGQVVEWAKESLDALDYLHGLNLFYGDLKPTNIICRKEDNKISLVDFGITRRIHYSKSMTQLGVGMSPFSPPEMADGYVDPRSDLYSLGATMHCLLTGVIPQHLETFKPVREYNPQISKEIELIVMRSLEPEVKYRFENAKAMKRALEKLSSGSGESLNPYLNNIDIANLTENGPAGDERFKTRELIIEFPTTGKLTVNGGFGRKKNLFMAFSIIIFLLIIFFLIKNFTSDNIPPDLLKVDMVKISGGTFDMGSRSGGNPGEKPVHKVTLSTFYMSKYEITNKLYCLYDSSHKHSGEKLPAVNISWNEAIDFCKWLSKKTGKNYSLPTEAQWEYACRGKTKTSYYWGNNISGLYCWYNGNSSGKIHNGGMKKPNRYGLCDMSGNVYEWCYDFYGPYSTAALNDPEGPSSGKGRVIRGGSFLSSPPYCRSSFREGLEPDEKRNDLGFRIVMIP